VGRKGEQRFHSLPRFVLVEFGKCALTYSPGRQYTSATNIKAIKGGSAGKPSIDAAVKEAELKALRSQVNPLSFFNSLNTNSSLIDESPPKARKA